VLDFAKLFAWCDLHVSRWRTLPATQGFISRPMYYDRDGFAIPSDGVEHPTLVWARIRETVDPVLARDELPDGSHLSTVWLGLDHSHIMGPPLIFETMRFAAAIDTFIMPGSGREVPHHPALAFPDPFGEPGEQTEQLRYTTAEEALAAHHEILRRLRLRLGS
jgi:hypothetical protein